MKNAILPNRFPSALKLWIFGAALILLCPIALIAADEEGDAVTFGKSALQDTAQPWYDAETDAVRIVSNKKDSQAGERQEWQKTATRPKWSIDWNWPWNWSWGGLGMPSFGDVLQGIGLLLLFALVGLIVYALVKSFAELETKENKSKRESAGAGRTDEQRIEQLPVRPTKRKGSFLEIARSYYESGNYSDAIVYLFSHRLIQLDKAGFIRLTRGKTNRQYLTEIRNPDDLRKIIGQTIVCFEDVFFGNHGLTKERFEQSWNANSRFDDILQAAS